MKVSPMVNPRIATPAVVIRRPIQKEYFQNESPNTSFENSNGDGINSNAYKKMKS
jgi:hypothetical protein